MHSSIPTLIVLAAVWSLVYSTIGAATATSAGQKQQQSQQNHLRTLVIVDEGEEDNDKRIYSQLYADLEGILILCTTRVFC